MQMYRNGQFICVSQNEKICLQLSLKNCYSRINGIVIWMHQSSSFTTIRMACVLRFWNSLLKYSAFELNATNFDAFGILSLAGLIFDNGRPRLDCNIWFVTIHTFCMGNGFGATAKRLDKGTNKRKVKWKLCAMIKWGLGLQNKSGWLNALHCSNSLNSKQNVDVCLDCWNSLVYIEPMYTHPFCRASQFAGRVASLMRLM